MKQHRTKANPKVSRPRDSEKQSPDIELSEGLYWPDLTLALFTILVGIGAAFMYLVDLYSALTLPLSLLGCCVATFALLLSVVHRRIDPHFQTIGLALCMVIVMAHYISSDGLSAAAFDMERLVKGEQPSEFIVFPHSFESVGESKSQSDRFSVDPDSVELTAARIEALMTELEIMGRIKSNLIVKAEWESEFQKRLSASLGKKVQWTFAVRSVDNHAVYLREVGAPVEILFLGQSRGSAYLQIGNHLDEELARSINANDRLKISGSVDLIEFSSDESTVALSNVSVRRVD